MNPANLKRSGIARRGFILLVVVGLLAVLLGICIGFLSFTRSEVNTVVNLRDRVDLTDMTLTAIDWTIANIDAVLIDPKTNLVRDDSTAANASDPSVQHYPVISRTHNTADPNYLWWYRPCDSGVSTWFSPVIKPADETQWIWLPQEYIPGGGLRGRFMVQVFDANAAINLNDWLEDCNPTQCQMANMIRDGLGGARFVEYERALGNKLPDPVVKPPFRYLTCWHLASRTLNFFSNSYDAPSSMSPQWVTTNTQYMAMNGADKFALQASIKWDNVNPGYLGSDGIGGMAGFSLYGYTDPDTGRSPVNVNTCPNSGEQQVDAGYSFTMNAVFNVESLRRIIKIGQFWNGTAYRNAITDAATLTPAEKTLVEQYKLKLAYEYQELLCRYFVGTYGCDYPYAAYPQRGYGPAAGANSFYNPKTPGGFNVNETFYSAYGNGSNPSGSEASKVLHAVRFYDNSKTRFPVSPAVFRQWVQTDLHTIATNNINKKYTGTNSDGWDTVGVDKSGNFEIAFGKMDARTASAVYDNIVPGKACLFKTTEIPAFVSNPLEVRDPLGQLYKQRLGLDENTEPDPTMDIYGYPAVNLKGGGDIRGGGVPYRQLAFGPDSFSVELTTASPMFYAVITTELVENALAAKPTVVQQQQVVAVLQIAPALECKETGDDGTSTGLHYYHDNRPLYYKTAPAGSLDSMDKNCTTLPVNAKTTIPSTWVDPHGVVDPATFYQSNSQNKARVTIRAFWNLSQMQ